MVNGTVAHLIAECDDITLFIAECAPHEVVAEMTADSLNVGILPRFLISLSELIIAP